MGNKFSRKSNKEHRVLWIGLKGAGKTTAFFQLKYGRISTIGLGTETFQYKDMNFTLFDVDPAGYDKIHVLWRHYYQDTEGIIWMIDSSNRDNIEQAHDMFHKILLEVNEYSKVKNISILMFGNKQDLPNAMNIEEIKDKMGMNRCIPVYPSFFDGIIDKTLLKLLPKDIFDIILEYISTLETGPSLKITPNYLMNKDIELIDKYLKYNNYRDNDGNEYKMKILKILCEYVPNYNYRMCSSKKYVVMGCSALTKQGLDEGLDSLYAAIQQSQ